MVAPRLNLNRLSPLFGRLFQSDGGHSCVYVGLDAAVAADGLIASDGEDTHCPLGR